MIWLVGLIVAAGTGLALLVVRTWVRIRRAAVLSASPETEVLAVLGAALKNDGTPSRVLIRRLQAAAELARADPSRLIICCGGVTSTDRSEGEAMRQTLLRWGLSPRAVVVDDRCPSTRNTVAVIRERWSCDGRPVTFVSSDYHIYRLLAEAKRHALPAGGHAVAQAPLRGAAGLPVRALLERTLREVLAVWWYAACGLATDGSVDHHDASDHEPVEQCDEVVVTHLHAAGR